MKNGRNDRKSAADEIHIETPGHDNSRGDLNVEGAAFADVRDTLDALKRSEERYRAFIKNSSEGIWRFELDKPIPVDLSVDEQIALAYARGFLAECNDAMAKQYGFDKAEDLTGTHLTDLLIEDDPNNRDFLKAFIESGYNLIDAESHEHNEAEPTDIFSIILSAKSKKAFWLVRGEHNAMLQVRGRQWKPPLISPPS